MGFRALQAVHPASVWMRPAFEAALLDATGAGATAVARPGRESRRPRGSPCWPFGSDRPASGQIEQNTWPAGLLIVAIYCPGLGCFGSYTLPQASPAALESLVIRVG